MLSFALLQYHEDHGHFPPPYSVDPQGRPLLSWRVLILPYLEENGLYESFHLDEPWDSAHNLALAQRLPEAFRDPLVSRSSRAITTPYVAVVDDETMWQVDEPFPRARIRDGASSTVQLVAWEDSDIVWSAPRDIDLKGVPRLAKLPPGKQSRYSPQPPGFWAAFADGRVSWIVPSKLSLPARRGMFTSAGGEKIEQELAP